MKTIAWLATVLMLTGCSAGALTYSERTPTRAYGCPPGQSLDCAGEYCRCR